MGEALKINKTLTTLECAHPLSHRPKPKCARFVVSRVRGSSLFGPCSLNDNEIGDEGAQHIGDALKINKTLTTLECAHPLSHRPKPKCARFVVSRVRGSSLFGPHSLGSNSIGDQGAQHIGEALKINTVLTSLECALASPPPQAKMRSLCCQQG
eukprot:scaffold787_cov115-Isochrysis_galbana.AAC.2